MRSSVWFLPLGAVATVAAIFAMPSGCSSTTNASAFKITNREQLIGGQRALGEIGDYKITNGIVQAIVQEKGNSRGFGSFGGSLIDVDLVRSAGNKATGGTGADAFTEMFPAFFLEAIEPNKVEVLADGKNGGAAIIRVSGQGGDFLSMLKGINELLLSTNTLDYNVDYILEPGKQYVKIVVTMTNPSTTAPVQFPVDLPLGFVTLLGEGQRLFVPGKAGFDMRYRLDDVYKQPSAIDGIPGEVVPWMAAEGDDVSYGLAASPIGAYYMDGKPQFYPTAELDSMLIPVASGSFLGTYWGKPPQSVLPGKSFSFTGFLAVGNGDVASVTKVIYNIEDERTKRPTGVISGRVREAGTRQPLANVPVIFQDEQGNYISATKTIDNGHFEAVVPPGKYKVNAADPIRKPASSDFVTVEANGGARVDITLERTASVTVTVRDETGRLVPAKISVEGIYDDATGRPAREFLYDLKLGEKMRTEDLIPDDAADPQTRKYLEKFFYLSSGQGGATIRPGHYKVYASRGIEYTIDSKEIDVGPNENREVQLQLTHVMKTPGYVSADFHVHSINSVDSDMGLVDRVSSYAAEGVDYITSTDHNYVTDFKPTTESLDLQDWLKTTVGLELTTLEMGHFNAFPLKLDPGAIRHGSFDWFRRPPGELFAQLRSIGSDPAKTLVQVNHPRFALMGYFEAFNLSAYTGETLPALTALALDQTPNADGSPSPYAGSNFSFDFDVLEVANGKHTEKLHHFRIPESTRRNKEPSVKACGSGGLVYNCIPKVGEVLQLSVEIPDPADPSKKIEVANPVYPGALDDYYSLTGLGRRFTAVGNSDSHGPHAEAGLPRTYVYVGDAADGSMRKLDEQQVADGLRAHRAVISAGPFVEMWVNDQPIGSDVISPDGSASVRIKIQAAPWVDVKRVMVRRGGPDKTREVETVATIDVPDSTELVRLEKTLSFTNLPDGAFFALEVTGDKSMWPVFTPYETEPIQIDEAVEQIGSSVGYKDKWGRFKPDPLHVVTPYALTNPIWVYRTKRQALKLAKPILPLGQSQEFRPRAIPDLRRLFSGLHADE